MTINYLVLAHQHPEHLSKLIDALDHPGINFYVHYDKKRQPNYENHRENVFVLSDRISVNWGCFSMVEATLLLIREAYEKTPADYYILLSGADYPIRSNNDIKKILSENLEYIEMKPAPFPRKPMSRFVYYHFEYNRQKKNLQWFFFRSLEELIYRLRIKRQVPFRVFAGAQWFALTHPCIDYILRTIDTDPHYLSFFKYVKIPDEAFFQTLVGNSPFAGKVADTLTYAYWTEKNSPLAITEEHIEMFAQFKQDTSLAPKVFARKFNKRNQYLLPLIESRLRTE